MKFKDYLTEDKIINNKALEYLSKFFDNDKIIIINIDDIFYLYFWKYKYYKNNKKIEYLKKSKNINDLGIKGVTYGERDKNLTRILNAKDVWVKNSGYYGSKYLK